MLNNVWVIFCCVGLGISYPCFSQSTNTFQLKGNHNEVYNQQSTTYRFDVDLLICVDRAVAGDGYIKPINAFVDLANWCIGYLDTRLRLGDSCTQALYANVYEIKNANDEGRTLRLINETLTYLQEVYGQNRHRLTPAEVDVFHRKYDELRSFRILNCLGDKFKLKHSEISDINYLESDSLKTDARHIDFELFRMSEGIRMVRVNGRYGYTENDSSFCVNPTFSEAHPFSNGLALVKNHTEIWFIDKKGNPVLPLTARHYLQVWPFKGGYARVEKANRMYNFIDTAGKELFAFDVHAAEDFSCGMAAVCVNPTSFYAILKTLPNYKKQAQRLKTLWQLDDKPVFGTRCGYIAPSGFFKIWPTYTSALSFTDGGRAPVGTGSVCEYARDSSDSFFSNDAAHRTCLIDTNGNTCTAEYCSIQPFADGLLLAQCEEGYYGVFGPSGLLLADCFYGKPVWEDPFLVYADGISQKYGVMGKNGMVLLPPEYDRIRFLANAQFELWKDNYKTTVYISPDGRIHKIKQQKAGAG